MASQKQHQCQGPDSEHDTVDEYGQTRSREGSLEDEVELGDGIDGAEGEDEERKHLAPPTTRTHNGLPCKSLHRTQDRDNHQSRIDNRVRRLVLRYKAHEQCRRAIEKISPHHQERPACKDGHLGSTVFDTLPSPNDRQEIRRHQHERHDHRPQENVSARSSDIRVILIGPRRDLPDTDRQRRYRQKENRHSQSPHHPLDKALTNNTLFELEHRMSNRIRNEVCLRQYPRVEYRNEIWKHRQSLNGSRLVDPVRNSHNNRTENQSENNHPPFHIRKQDRASEFFGER